MTAIIDIIGREILDSRGNPTVEVDVVLEDGAMAARRCRRAPRPARTRRSSCATATRRRYLGKGVEKAVDDVNGEIFDALVGMDAEDQRGIDAAMIQLDGTRNKSRLGANAILGVSLAAAKAAAEASGLPLYRYLGGADAHVLPVPMMNIVNGGAHADNPIAIRSLFKRRQGTTNCDQLDVRKGPDGPRVDLRRDQVRPARLRRRDARRPPRNGRRREHRLPRPDPGRRHVGRRRHRAAALGADEVTRGRRRRSREGDRDEPPGDRRCRPRSASWRRCSRTPPSRAAPGSAAAARSRSWPTGPPKLRRSSARPCRGAQEVASRYSRVSPSATRTMRSCSRRWATA